MRGTRRSRGSARARARALYEVFGKKVYALEKLLFNTVLQLQLTRVLPPQTSFSRRDGEERMDAQTGGEGRINL